MSWSASFTVEGGEVLKESIFQSGCDIDDPTEAVSAALWATFNILSSGAVGSEEKTYSVTLGGHENIDHEPTAGWANDSIQVSVVQK